MRARLRLRRSAASASAAIPPATSYSSCLAHTASARASTSAHALSSYAPSSSRLKLASSRPSSSPSNSPLYFLYPALARPTRRCASSSAAAAQAVVEDSSVQSEERIERQEYGFFSAAPPSSSVGFSGKAKGKQRQLDVASQLEDGQSASREKGKAKEVGEQMEVRGSESEAGYAGVSKSQGRATASEARGSGTAASTLTRARALLAQGEVLQAAECMREVLQREKSKAANKLAQEVLQVLCQPADSSAPAQRRKLPSKAHADAAARLFQALIVPGRATSEYARAVMGGDARDGTGGLHAAVQVLRALLERSWAVRKEQQQREPFNRSNWHQHQYVSTNLLLTFQQAFAQSAEAVRQSDQERSPAAKALKAEHGKATLALGQLLVDKLLPPPASTPKIEQASRRRFETLTWALRTLTRPPTTEAAHTRTERARRALIDEYMLGLIGNAPVARIDPAHPHASLITVNDFNALLCDALRPRADSKVALQLLRAMLAHGIQPDSISVNILLHRATRRQDTQLAHAALRITTAGRPSSSIAAATSVAASQTAPTLIRQLQQAVQSGDTYRLVALLALATASSQFRQARQAPHVVPLPSHRPAFSSSSSNSGRGRRTYAAPRQRNAQSSTNVQRVIMLLYPILSLKLRQRLRARLIRLEETLVASPKDKLARLELHRIDTAWRASKLMQGAAFHPRVLASAHNLCVKAGATGLAWRVWRLLRTCARRSARESTEKAEAEVGVGGKNMQWEVPLQAATAQMQLYAREARKGMSAYQLAVEAGQRLAVPAHTQVRSLTYARRRSRRYARGYGAIPSRTALHRRRALLGASIPSVRTQRWLVARRAAARDYEWLMAHWQGAGWRVKPDAVFFGAALDVFTRARGTKARRARRWPARVAADIEAQDAEARGRGGAGFDEGGAEGTKEEEYDEEHFWTDEEESYARARSKADAWTWMTRRIVTDMLAVGLAVPIVFAQYVAKSKSGGGGPSSAEPTTTAVIRAQQQQYQLQKRMAKKQEGESAKVSMLEEEGTQGQ